MHNTITTYRQLFPVVFVVGLILGLITSFLIPFLWFFYVSVVLIYLFCCMNFGIKSGSSFKQGLKIAKIFPVLHLSYGWGYLIAIFKFLIETDFQKILNFQKKALKIFLIVKKCLMRNNIKIRF